MRACWPSQTETSAIGLAGVMGGRNSEITDPDANGAAGAASSTAPTTDTPSRALGILSEAAARLSEAGQTGRGAGQRPRGN